MYTSQTEVWLHWMEQIKHSVHIFILANAEQILQSFFFLLILFRLGSGYVVDAPYPKGYTVRVFQNTLIKSAVSRVHFLNCPFEGSK